MPVTKSAEKAMRSSGRKRLRNKSIKTLSKTRITKAEKLITSGDLETARKAVVSAISSLDKAAEKGIIHPNNAARRKSRLAKKLNKAQAPATGKGSASKKHNPKVKGRTAITL